MFASAIAHFNAAKMLVGQPLSEGLYKTAVEEAIAHDLKRGAVRDANLEAFARSGVSESVQYIWKDGAQEYKRDQYINRMTIDGVSRETAAALVDETFRQMQPG